MSNSFLSGQALELDASEILKEVMPKLPEPFSKYIDTLDDDEDETAPIDVKHKREIRLWNLETSILLI